MPRWFFGGLWIALVGIYPLADPGHWPINGLVLIDYAAHALGVWTAWMNRPTITWDRNQDL